MVLSTERVNGYWDKGEVEIDLVAVNDEERRIRFGSCKRNPAKLARSLPGLKRSAQQFLAVQKRYADWSVDYVGIAPQLSSEQRQQIQSAGVVAQSLSDLVDRYPRS